jgi:hypothetical protein
MKGRAPSGNEGAQSRRTPKPSAARKRRAADLPTPEPLADPNQPSPVYPAAYGMSGSVETAGNMAARVRRRTDALDRTLTTF